MMLSPFVGQKLGTFVNKENHEDMLVLKELIESGKVTPVIDRTYPLAEVPRPSGIWKKDTLEEKSSSACETSPKEDSCSHSGGEEVTGEHRSGRGEFRPGGGEGNERWKNLGPKSTVAAWARRSA